MGRAGLGCSHTSSLRGEASFRQSRETRGGPQAGLRQRTGYEAELRKTPSISRSPSARARFRKAGRPHLFRSGFHKVSLPVQLKDEAAGGDFYLDLADGPAIAAEPDLFSNPETYCRRSAPAHALRRTDAVQAWREIAIEV